MTIATNLTAVFGILTLLIQAAALLLLLAALRGLLNGQIRQMTTFFLIIVLMFVAFEVAMLLVTFYATPDMVNIAGPGGLLALNGMIFIISYKIWDFARSYKFADNMPAEKLVKKRRTRR